MEVAPDLDAEVSFVHLNSDGHRILHHTYPIFYEQQNYEIIIENNSADVIEFWHENLGLRNKISPLSAAQVKCYPASLTSAMKLVKVIL